MPLKEHSSGIIEVCQGDITKICADAIVNAANSSLLGGSGVDGAIHREGGHEILEECMRIRSRQGGCRTGEAVITSAGKLSAKFVIHAVGPVWKGGEYREEALLALTYHNSLRLAIENQVKTIAFPNISTGAYHFPKITAAKVALKSVQDFLAEKSLKKIFFVCYDYENYKIYRELLKIED